VKIFRILLITLLFAGGSYTFGQTFANLPIGSPEAVQEYQDSIVDYYDVKLSRIDDATGARVNYFHIGEDIPKGLPREVVIEKVRVLLKRALDSLLLPERLGHTTNATFHLGYMGTSRGVVGVYLTHNVPFRLFKDEQGQWRVPPKLYEVIWEIKPDSTFYMAIDFPHKVKRVRIAVQHVDIGLLSRIYDSEADKDKPHLKRVVMLLPEFPNQFRMHVGFAMTGYPGLITVFWTDNNGNERTTLFNLQNGERLHPLKVEAFPPPGEGAVLVTVAGNPEKDQVVEVSNSLSPPAWRLLDFVDKTTYGQRLIPYQEQGEHAFYRIRWVSDLEAASLKQQALAKENGN